MRVMNKADFLKLPPGVAYCCGKKWYFYSLNFKGDSIPDTVGDWYELDPAWVDGHDSGECFDRLTDMLEKGASYPMQDSECRNGLYEDDDIFLVFEKADLLKLKEWIDAAISVSP